MKIPRLSPETLLVLECFFQRATEWRYGYELSRQTGLKSGTLYPILMRLEKCALLEAKWVATEDGVPPRHTYRLTQEAWKWQAPSWPKRARAHWWGNPLSVVGNHAGSTGSDKLQRYSGFRHPHRSSSFTRVGQGDEAAN